MTGAADGGGEGPAISADGFAPCASPVAAHVGQGRPGAGLGLPEKSVGDFAWIASRAEVCAGLLPAAAMMAAPWRRISRRRDSGRRYRPESETPAPERKPAGGGGGEDRHYEAGGADGPCLN
jgi:hypothetical protein